MHTAVRFGEKDYLKELRDILNQLETRKGLWMVDYFCMPCVWRRGSCGTDQKRDFANSITTFFFLPLPMFFMTKLHDA